MQEADAASAHRTQTVLLDTASPRFLGARGSVAGATGKKAGADATHRPLADISRHYRLRATDTHFATLGIGAPPMVSCPVAVGTIEEMIFFAESYSEWVGDGNQGGNGLGSVHFFDTTGE
jgi:hypothetical protein